MKIKKSLLTSIAAGIAMSASISSCGTFDSVADGFDNRNDRDNITGTCGDFDCGPCGMG